jgi:hypothetical protein
MWGQGISIVQQVLVLNFLPITAYKTLKTFLLLSIWLTTSKKKKVLTHCLFSFFLS